MLRPVDRLALAIATGLGAGSSPLAPGTVGTAVAVPIAVATAGLGPAPYVTLCAVVTVVAIWAAGQADRLLGTHDSSRIVVDEIVGYLVAVAWIDRSDPVLLAAGFVVFRVADVIKPPPARRLDAGWRGGAGVVLDDVVAGLYASILVSGMALTDLHGHVRALWR
jgi:phosphatidylglycerophosphatase A